MSRAIIEMPTREILNLWFGRAGPLNQITGQKMFTSYFARDEAFDDECRKYEPRIDQLVDHYTVKHALPSLHPFKKADVSSFKTFPESREETLSHILLLDQFTRNIWRGDDAAKVYKVTDPIAYQLALYAAQQDWKKETSWLEELFFSLPLEHSEHLPTHVKSLQMWAQTMAEIELDVEAGKKTVQEQKVALGIVKHQADHMDLIVRFGRYPHRNEALGRKPTEEEAKYMAKGGLDFGTSD